MNETLKMDHSQIRSMYEVELVSLGTIAKRLGVSRTTIHNQLRSMGIDTKKRLREVKCLYCGTTILRSRVQIRTRQNFFCNRDHYIKSLQNPELTKHRQGQKVAKTVFEACIGILDFDPIIHHVDDNPDNNHPSNLWGFKTQSDHLFYHNGGKTMALKIDTRKWEEVCTQSSE